MGKIEANYPRARKRTWEILQCEGEDQVVGEVGGEVVGAEGRAPYVPHIHFSHPLQQFLCVILALEPDELQILMSHKLSKGITFQPRCRCSAPVCSSR